MIDAWSILNVVAAVALAVAVLVLGAYWWLSASIPRTLERLDIDVAMLTEGDTVLETNLADSRVATARIAARAEELEARVDALTRRVETMRGTDIGWTAEIQAELDETLLERNRLRAEVERERQRREEMMRLTAAQKHGLDRMKARLRWLRRIVPLVEAIGRVNLRRDGP